MKRAMRLMLVMAMAATTTSLANAAGPRLTRYAQSCFLLEDGHGATLLVDPGNYNYGPGLLARNHFKKVSTLIITHKHADHFDLATVQDIVKSSPGVAIWTTEDVAKTLAAAGIQATVLAPGQSGSWAGGSFTAVRADHVVRGEPIPCFGVVVHTGGKTLYMASDTLYFHPLVLGLQKGKVDVMMLPIIDRGLTMDIDQAVAFATELAPRVLIPIHYDSPNDKGRVKPADFVSKAKKAGLGAQLLEFGHSLQL